MTDPGSKDTNLMSKLSTVLVLPVLVCGAIGGIFLVTKSDPKEGLFLIGVACSLGVLNFFIIKHMARKFQEAQNSNREES